MKIRFHGPIMVIKQNYDGTEQETITKVPELRKLDGKRHKDNLVDYLFDGNDAEHLKPLDIKGGHLGLYLEGHQIHVYMDFYTNAQPNQEQIDTLWRFVEGQLYDGAGPIFSGDCADEIGLSPLTHTVKAQFTITDEEEPLNLQQLKYVLLVIGLLGAGYCGYMLFKGDVSSTNIMGLIGSVVLIGGFIELYRRGKSN